jgi:hypothetical protein
LAAAVGQSLEGSALGEASEDTSSTSLTRDQPFQGEFGQGLAHDRAADPAPPAAFRSGGDHVAGFPMASRDLLAQGLLELGVERQRIPEIHVEK